MFPDRKEAIMVLSAYSEARRKGGAPRKKLDCTLSELVVCAMKNFDLDKYTEDAIKQAVYKIVRENKIWLSHSRKAKT